MKICPTCSRNYEDDTLVFCLDDGARLAQGRDPQATWRLPEPSANEPRRSVPPTTPSPPATITARPEHFQGLAQPQPSAPPPAYHDEPKRNNVLPWILGIAVVLGISGVLIAWLLTRGSGERVAIIYPSPTPTVEVMSTPDTYRTPEKVTPTPVVSPTAKDERRPKPTEEPTAPKKPAFSMLNNTSYSGGSRITYYPRASVGQCQADCAANASCRAFTWIRPGAYNPGDSAMCYLMYSVSGPVSHPCCISGVKN